LTGGSANSFNGLNRKLKKRPQQPFPLRHAAGFDAEGLLIVSDKAVKAYLDSYEKRFIPL